jgi:hypothetical protein
MLRQAGDYSCSGGDIMTEEEKTNEQRRSRSRNQRRRGKGEGSIYPDKKNDRWVGSFFTGDGKRIYV